VGPHVRSWWDLEKYATRARLKTGFWFGHPGICLQNTGRQANPRPFCKGEAGGKINSFKPPQIAMGANPWI
jgi:hypothetical protein